MNAHALATGTVGGNDLPDFSTYCIAVECAAGVLERHTLREIVRQEADRRD